MAKKGSLREMPFGRLDDLIRILDAAGLDDHIGTAMITRPHLATEMLDMYHRLMDPTSWMHENLTGVVDMTPVVHMPLGSIGWVSGDVFNCHHDGFGAYAWPELCARAVQTYGLVYRGFGGTSLRGGLFPIIRARTGSFWTLATSISGRLLKPGMNDTDINVQIVDTRKLRRILDALPGHASPSVTVERTTTASIGVTGSTEA